MSVSTNGPSQGMESRFRRWVRELESRLHKSNEDEWLLSPFVPSLALPFDISNTPSSIFFVREHGNVHATPV